MSSDPIDDRFLRALEAYRASAAPERKRELERAVEGMTNIRPVALITDIVTSEIGSGPSAHSRWYRVIIDTLLLAARTNEDWTALLALREPPVVRSPAGVRSVAHAAERIPALAPALASLLVTYLEGAVETANDYDLAVSIAFILRSPMLATLPALQPALRVAIDITGWDMLLKYTVLHIRLAPDIKDLIHRQLVRKARDTVDEGPSEPEARDYYENEILPSLRFVERQPWIAAVMAVSRQFDAAEARAAAGARAGGDLHTKDGRSADKRRRRAVSTEQ